MEDIDSRILRIL